MAENATIYKATLHIANIDQQYYADHQLTLAQHPSETNERLMVRLLAFMMYANEQLSPSGKGLCSDDEPDFALKDLTGAYQRWIMVGLPDEKLIRKACNKSTQVVVVTYGRAADIWWRDIMNKITRYPQLTIWRLPTVATESLAKLLTRTMQIQCSIQDGTLMLTLGHDVIDIEPQCLWGSAAISA